MIETDNLPRGFTESMKAQLKENFGAYLEALGDRHVSGVRINTLKANPDSVFKELGTEPERVPWAPTGFYIPESSLYTRHPFYYAGLYYIQEPSAMTPVTWLSPEPGDKVLDLCAAPGGKSTQAACYLGEAGALYSNDPSASRCKALLKNIELSGIGNAVITCADPAELADVYPEYFDRVLVDAPCSGEGMFRKDRAVMKAYLEHGPEYFAPIQRSVLSQAYRMLKPGGHMVYSTCTFSCLEDEENILWFTGEYPDMEVLKMTKLYPHEVKGEGHFVTLLHKKGESSSASARIPAGKTSGGSIPKDFLDFMGRTGLVLEEERVYLRDEYIYYLPKGAVLDRRIHYIRTGLLFGRMRNGRFEPSQAFAMSLTAKDWDRALILKSSDDRVMRYLKGETIEADDDYEGYRLVCIEDWPLGWVKQSGKRCKNKYYPGWRYE